MLFPTVLYIYEIISLIRSDSLGNTTLFVTTDKYGRPESETLVPRYRTIDSHILEQAARTLHNHISPLPSPLMLFQDEFEPHAIYMALASVGLSALVNAAAPNETSEKPASRIIRHTPEPHCNQASSRETVGSGSLPEYPTGLFSFFSAEVVTPSEARDSCCSLR
ncbi:hypothetical protein LZ32DRAFT_116946 [Colletotrichum eremochloae]|nr:hypothetical protein LZ32DRAFT_116946 [Colletotrichum eremochloae]